MLLTILIPIPYLLGLDGTHERGSIYFFYFLWNTMFSIVLSLMFSQKKLTTSVYLISKTDDTT